MYSKLSYYIFLISFIFFQGLLLAQEEYTFKQISIDHGLPGTNVRYQFQDSRGIMWISVEAMGVCRYDGHSFKLLTTSSKDSNTVSSNFVNCINEDVNGNIWIGTDHGLNKYDFSTGNIHRYYFNHEDSLSLPSSTITTIDKDKEGNLWIGTANGFAKLNLSDHSFKRCLFYSGNNGLKEKIYINKIFNDSSDVFWLATTTGFYKYLSSSNTYKCWNSKDNLVPHINIDYVYDIVKDKYGTLWLATSLGLVMYNPAENSFTKYHYKWINDYEMDDIGMWTLLLDKEGILWSGSTISGVMLINTNDGSYTHVSTENSLVDGFASNHIRCITEDENGVIWIGTKFGGLLKFVNRNKVFNNIPEKYALLNKISNKYLLEIKKDNSGNYYFATKFSGLYRINLEENKIENFQFNTNNPGSISTNRIRTSQIDSKGNLWVGTDYGLDALKKGANKFIHFEDKAVTRIVEDPFGVIWVGTYRGIYVLDKKKLTLEKHKLSTKYDFFQREDFNITYLFIDSNNNLYFSTRYKGLFILNLETEILEHYSNDLTPETGIAANMIRKVYEDIEGNIWIGTKEAGLQKFDAKGKKFISYDMNDGLSSNMILCIQQDTFGNLWLGTQNGLSRFTPENKQFTNFSIYHGVKSIISELGADYCFDDGALLFGGSKGFNIFYPDQIEKTERLSFVNISSLKINSIDRYMDIVRPIQLTLKHNEKNLSFDFFLADYNQPARHKFKCWLEGFDDDWIYLENRNYAVYNNLSPGNYIFHVTGSNELGGWCDELSLSITILEPWWQMLIFRIILICLIIGAVLLIYFLRMHRIEKQKRILEREVIKRTEQLNDTNVLLEERQQQVEEQAEELTAIAEEMSIKNADLEHSNETKDKLFSIIAHDLKNPFSSIMGFTELLQTRFDKMSTEKIQRMISLINSSAHSVYNLLENLLFWSRSQSGTIKVEKSTFFINEVIKENISLLKSNAAIKSVVIDNKIPDDLKTCSDKQMLSTVIRNVLSNSIKFTENGTIVISAKTEASQIQIQIKDSGVGMDEEKTASLFEINKNKSTEGTKGEHGTGLGLIVCKEFVELNGGEIIVESEVDKGTIFSFTVPNA